MYYNALRNIDHTAGGRAESEDHTRTPPVKPSGSHRAAAYTCASRGVFHLPEDERRERSRGDPGDREEAKLRVHREAGFDCRSQKARGGTIGDEVELGRERRSSSGQLIN